MNFSWRQLLAPWAGGLAGWFASQGLNFTPDQVVTLIIACAAGGANLLHMLEAWLAPKAVTTALSASDPAKKPPGPLVSVALLAVLLTVSALPLLSACSALALAPAQSADESIAYGYGLYTAVEEALSACVAAGQVTKATASAVDQKAGQARLLLDAARAAETVNPAGAETDLASATQMLTVLQTWLNSPTGAPPL